jgi:hypothetical protein
MESSLWKRKMTGALLDRLTHRASILELVGESYRFSQHLLQEEWQTDKATTTQAGQLCARNLARGT